MNSIRTALLLLAAMLLPSCRHLHPKWLTVSVQNHGTVSADLHAEAEYWPHLGQEDHVDLQVYPDQSASIWIRFDDLDRLRVRIVRSSDGEKIFDDSWDWQELDDLNGRVTITISP